MPQTQKREMNPHQSSSWDLVLTFSAFYFPLLFGHFELKGQRKKLCIWSRRSPCNLLLHEAFLVLAELKQHHESKLLDMNMSFERIKLGLSVSNLLCLKCWLFFVRKKIQRKTRIWHQMSRESFFGENLIPKVWTS